MPRCRFGSVPPGSSGATLGKPGRYFTVVATVAALSWRSGSAAEPVTFTVSEIVVALGATTVTTIFSCTTAPTETVPTVHLTVPVAPTAGTTQLAPLGADSDWNWTFDGRVSETTALGAADGPAFCTVIA